MPREGHPGAGRRCPGSGCDRPRPALAVRRATLTDAAACQTIYAPYVERGRRRTGAGRLLSDSEGLHRSRGFEEIGTWHRVGWKLGRWHDVGWMQEQMAMGSEPPAELR